MKERERVMPSSFSSSCWVIEIIPKFICLLSRGQPVVLHGDGSPTRRYLFAGDAADAFDTILHKGQLGQIYNVGSYDEISNLDLCERLLAEIGAATVIPQPDFTPKRLATELRLRLDEPRRLTEAAAAAKSAGITDASERLAAIVMSLGHIDVAEGGSR